jgi:hypothetical protein
MTFRRCPLDQTVGAAVSLSTADPSLRQQHATTGPAAYSDLWDGGRGKLEFLADAGRKPPSVKFHTARAVGGVVRCRFERVSAGPDPTR